MFLNPTPMKKIVLTYIIILAISVLHAQSNGNSDMDVTAVDIDLPGNIIIKQSTGTQMWSVKANNHNYRKANYHSNRKTNYYYYPKTNREAYHYNKRKTN